MRPRNGGRRWSEYEPEGDFAEQAEKWLDSVDTTTYVGSRHHTVPRFVLKRWADGANQVRAYRRIEQSGGRTNISDLAIKDFYTVVNVDGSKSSAVESMMGIVESNARPHLERILNPFVAPDALGQDAIAPLNQFAAFQSVRTARRRKELELQAEWFAKKQAGVRFSEKDLERLAIAPHQNETIILAAKAAAMLTPHFACRPLAIMRLGKPLLWTCDEPVLVNSASGANHTPDCFLTESQIERRVRRARRKVGGQTTPAHGLGGRTIHLTSTMPMGHGIAEEIAMAISPGTALLWGPPGPDLVDGTIESIVLDSDEAVQFAIQLNEAMAAQALDWIASRVSDLQFADATFPPLGPLMRVCDGPGAANSAINDAPRRYRPTRLWTPT